MLHIYKHKNTYSLDVIKWYVLDKRSMLGNTELCPEQTVYIFYTEAYCGLSILVLLDDFCFFFYYRLKIYLVLVFS